YFNKHQQNVTDEDKVIVIVDNDISKSFNGLIANKLAQTFGRPCIVMSQDDDLLHGSYRSYAGFNAKEFFEQIDAVNWARGHNEAGGVEVHISMFNEFKYNINKLFSNSINNNVVEYD